MVLYETWDESDTRLPSHVIETIYLYPPGEQEGISTSFNIATMPYKEMKMMQLLPHMLLVIRTDNGEETQPRGDQWLW